jgi:hypothetical protein
LKVTRDNQAAVDLTAEGTRDWMHFGLFNASDVNHKDFVTPVLTEVTTGTGTRYGSFNPNITWTDGTPTGSASNSSAGIYASGNTHGFTFTAPASTTKQTLRLHVGVFRGTGTLVAHLSDGSLADVTTNDTNNSGLKMSRFSVEFRSTTPGTTLTVSWMLTNDNTGGAVDLVAVTLF